tara:strand:+ start:6410 stop:6802 length:393 start_codon:yes stop_codon:yes gene_type:complete
MAVLVSGLPVQAADRVPMPKVPKALEKTEKGHAKLMRLKHMDLMRHQRDETVHKGIRTKQYSLKACISCHAVAGPDKQPVSITSPKHFCRSCHDYAAVKVDCFQCHSSKPPSSASLKLPLTKQIQGFLRR